jgi:hypothetical protein
MSSPTPTAAPKITSSTFTSTGLVSKIDTYAHDAESGVGHTVSSWHFNGWWFVAAVIAANVLGVFVHI